MTSSRRPCGYICWREFGQAKLGPRFVTYPGRPQAGTGVSSPAALRPSCSARAKARSSSFRNGDRMRSPSALLEVMLLREMRPTETSIRRSAPLCSIGSQQRAKPPISVRSAVTATPARPRGLGTDGEGSLRFRMVGDGQEANVPTEVAVSDPPAWTAAEPSAQEVVILPQAGTSWLGQTVWAASPSGFHPSGRLSQPAAAAKLSAQARISGSSGR
jgi:hypothetical protein